MKLESLICNSCGAPLKVPETANFVRCNHCGTQLAIRRTASETFTEQLEKLNQTTSKLSEQVAQLVQQNQLAELDKAWDREKERYMITSKHGKKHLPSESGAVIGGVVLTVFGIFWTAMAMGASRGGGPGSFFPCFGVVFIGFGIVISISNYNKARDYRAAHRRYLSRRKSLSRDQAGSSPDKYLAELENMPTAGDLQDESSDPKAW